MYNINPINIPTRGEVNKLSVQVNAFALFPTEVILYYRLEGENNFIDGNLTVPQAVVDVWGTDDTVILNYAVSALGVELAPEPEA